MSLAFRQYGNGPHSIIFLHGLFASKENFHSLARRLEQDATCYLLDLRNHGESFHSSEMNYSLMARDALDFIEEQKINEPVLLGHSVGGKVAMELALMEPEMITSLIVEDIAPRRYEPTVYKELMALKELPVEEFTGRGEAEKWMVERLGNRAVARFLLKNLVSRDEGGYRLRLDIESIHHNYEHLLDFQPGERTCNKRTLFLKGGASRFIAEKDYELIKAVFPESRIEVLADTSHWVHAERLDDTVEFIQEFLR